MTHQIQENVVKRHRPLARAATGLVAALALTSCTSSSSEPDVAGPAPDPATTAPGAPAATPSTTPTTTAPVATPPTPTKAPVPTATKTPVDVKAVQTRLRALKYYVGTVDGESGGATRSAVMAFQKVNGLGADGTIGAKTLAALQAPKAPVLRDRTPADRVEVDLTKQVLYVVKGGALQRIMPVSSGNGERYTQKDGDKATALTPVGYFRIERRIVGLREADLGSLYDPQYFYKGWAIHGSNSVPAGPASHGCVRVTRTDAKYLLDAIRVGMTVHLYGGTHTFKAGSSAPGTDNPTGDDSPATPAPTKPTMAPSTPPTPVRPSAPTPTALPTLPGRPAPTPVPTTTGP